MRIEAIIFDFNGVLVNDEPLHFRGFQQALETENLKITWEKYYEKYLPYDDRNFLVNFLSDQGEPADAERVRHLIDLKSTYYFRTIEERPPIIQSSIDFVLRLNSELPLGIASGAARKEIKFILQSLGLLERFSVIIAAADVLNGKPHPEAFLKTLQELQKEQSQLDAERVVVIEDSERGIRSVHAAEMKCIGLATTYPVERLRSADLVVESLEGWTLKKLESALESGLEK